jgi:MoaA/NifB/PqqE/SkfB family radical SAM enzyme
MMSEDNKDVICPLPWHHIAIRPNGRVYPCCYFRHEDTPEEFNLSYNNVFKHPFLDSVRTAITYNKKVDGCKQCYHNEKFTGKSMRLDTLETFEKINDKPFEVPDQPNLTYVDIAFSNVCNNRCRMCNPELSTNWYADAKALGIPINKGIIENSDPFKNIDVSNLNFIKFIGGEPMLEQEKFINLLNRCNLSSLSLFIATNVTTKPNAELMKLFRKCKQVKISCSIDAYGRLNDFLRKGSVWEEVDRNLKWYANTFDIVTVHSVVSIYNINKIHELYEHVQKNYPNVSFQFVMVDGPDWIRPCNLPIDVKDTLMKQIYQIQHQDIIDLFPIIYDSLTRPGSFAKFKEMDDKLNLLRNEHWKDHNPELYEMLKEYYE